MILDLMLPDRALNLCYSHHLESLEVEARPQIRSRWAAARFQQLARHGRMADGAAAHLKRLTLIRPPGFRLTRLSYFTTPCCRDDEAKPDRIISVSDRITARSSQSLRNRGGNLYCCS